jgi:dolichol-phosphate mannosyltransferase
MADCDMTGLASGRRDCEGDAAAVLSVVMPVYNEEAAIVLAFAEVRDCILDRVERSELVVVNDGSTDQTGKLLDALAQTDARVRVVHQINQGHGGALMTGLNASRGAWVMLVDSDRQIALDDFADAWSAADEGYDAVFGVRRRRYDPALRLYLTVAVRLSVTALFNVSLTDANAPYKLIRRSLWEQARPVIPSGTLAPSLFLAVFARWHGHRIREMDVVHRARETGLSSIRRWRLLTFCVKAFRQMIVFRRRVRHVR